MVLDPWGGSGTTGIVASRVGIPSTTTEINPVMAAFAAAKSAQVLVHKDELISFFEDMETAIRAQGRGQDEEILADIFAPQTAAFIRSIVNSIPFPLHVERRDAQAAMPVSFALYEAAQVINPVHAFSLAVIFVAIRKLSGIERASNPTWLKAREDKVSIAPPVLFGELRSNVRTMLADVETYFEGGAGAANLTFHADVKSLPLADGSVDAIITSPPYLTRIDYAMATMPEMYLLGDEGLLTETRHRTMGAPVITKVDKHQKADWGPTCNRVLDVIKAHPTKAARTYYWKNIVQYFMDLDVALNEMQRVLTAGGKALVVVQGSYFKDVEIPLGDIYCEMAENKGLTAKFAFREEVRGHMAHVNTKSSQYKKNKVYREETVYIGK